MVGKTFMVNADISAGDKYPSGYRKANYSGVTFCRVDVDEDDVQLLFFPPMEKVIRMFVI